MILNINNIITLITSITLQIETSSLLGNFNVPYRINWLVTDLDGCMRTPFPIILHNNIWKKPTSLNMVCFGVIYVTFNDILESWKPTRLDYGTFWSYLRNI